MARLSFRCAPELVARVDVVRGREPREAWLRRAVEQALEGLGTDHPRSDVNAVGVATAAPMVASPAPAEQPFASAAPPVTHFVALPVRDRASSFAAKRDVRPIPKKGKT